MTAFVIVGRSTGLVLTSQKANKDKTMTEQSTSQETTAQLVEQQTTEPSVAVAPPPTPQPAPAVNNPLVPTQGSKAGIQALSKELEAILKSPSYKDGGYTVECVDDNMYKWHVKYVLPQQHNHKTATRIIEMLIC